MNSVSTNESEQCLESRLGWVHRVHTLNPGCAPTVRALRLGRTYSARWAPCRGLPRPYRGFPPAVSWSCRCAHVSAGAPCRSAAVFALDHDTIFVSRLDSPIASTTRRVARAAVRVAAPNVVSWSIAASYHSLACCITTQSRPPQP